MKPFLEQTKFNDAFIYINALDLSSIAVHLYKRIFQHLLSPLFGALACMHMSIIMLNDPIVRCKTCLFAQFATSMPFCI